MHTNWKHYLRRVHFKGRQPTIRDAGPRGRLGSVSRMSELLTGLIRQNPERELASLIVPLELPFVDAAVCAGTGQVAGFYSKTHTHTDTHTHTHTCTPARTHARTHTHTYERKEECWRRRTNEAAIAHTTGNASVVTVVNNCVLHSLIR